MKGKKIAAALVALSLMLSAAAFSACSNDKPVGSSSDVGSASVQNTAGDNSVGNSAGSPAGGNSTVGGSSAGSPAGGNSTTNNSTTNNSSVGGGGSHSAGGSSSGGGASGGGSSGGASGYAPELPADMTRGGDYPSENNAVFLSPSGNDSASGTKDDPKFSLAAAVGGAKAGTVIMMLPGVYEYADTTYFSASGTADAPIYVQAYNWESVVLDFRQIPYGFNKNGGWGIYITGNYWHIQGLELMYAGDNAIKVEGSHNYIGRCVTHHNGDTGIQLGFGHHNNENNPGDLCAYNTIENCDSYKNYDYDNHGDADGFACKMHNGKNNVFIGCRAWQNCDDAWDLYETNYPVYIVNCWAWYSGIAEGFDDFDKDYLAKNGVSVGSMGNGNGIKLGGNGEGGDSKGRHYVYNCASFGNDKTGSVKGFDENGHKDGNTVVNCVAWDNGYNYMFEEGTSESTLFRNCLSLRTSAGHLAANKGQVEFEKHSSIDNCNFGYTAKEAKGTIIYEVTESDFITLSVQAASAPRGADGSLPANGFGQLTPEARSKYGDNLGLLPIS